MSANAGRRKGLKRKYLLWCFRDRTVCRLVPTCPTVTGNGNTTKGIFLHRRQHEKTTNHERDKKSSMG